MSENPPQKLKDVVDRTATYVAKNGAALEERIKSQQLNNPKFSFLFKGDPFHLYYQLKVNEIRDSLLGSLNETINNDHSSANAVSDDDNKQQSPTKEPESNDVTNQERTVDDNQDHTHKITEFNSSDDNEKHVEENQVESSGQPKSRLLNEYIEEKTMKLEEPPDLNFTAKPAPSLTLMQSDIIKLTARYIATYGRSFLLDLINREHNNPIFDFTKPQHGQFTYMTNLIMQYALIQNHPLGIVEDLDKDASSQKELLDKFKMRTEWSRMLESERKQREERIEREKLLYSQVDWHDFVVVETINYQPDEMGEYPPTTANQVGTRLLMQERLEQTKLVPQEMDIDMDMDMDMGSDEDTDEDNNEVEEGEIHIERHNQKNDVDEFILPEPPKNVVIKKDYDPKAANKSTAQSDDYYISPITNERIPISKIDEHVKYNLSDPKHLEKKSQMLEEKMNEEAVFASGSQVQNSLNSFAERRTDIFGMNHQETLIGRRIGDEDKTNQTKEDIVIWDGHKSSLKKKKIG